LSIKNAHLRNADLVVYTSELCDNPPLLFLYVGFSYCIKTPMEAQPPTRLEFTRLRHYWTCILSNVHPEGANKGSKRDFHLPAKICALVLDSARPIEYTLFH
jgi:hypothetical protein